MNRWKSIQEPIDVGFCGRVTEGNSQRSGRFIFGAAHGQQNMGWALPKPRRPLHQAGKSLSQRCILGR
jgi:hypothetical protein